MPIFSMNKNRVSIAGVLDAETTGFSPKTDEIIELGLVVFSFNRSTGQVQQVIEEYSGLREPGVPISKGASRVHGIYKRAISGMTLNHTKVKTLLEKVEFIIAHNARFDYGFMSRLYHEVTGIPWFCSMNGIRWKDKGFSSKALQYLLAAHGIEPHRKHRAKDDAMATLNLITGSGNAGNYLLELLDSTPINYNDMNYYTTVKGTN